VSSDSQYPECSRAAADAPGWLGVAVLGVYRASKQPIQCSESTPDLQFLVELRDLNP
jgi:hypothetical protein